MKFKSTQDSILVRQPNKLHIKKLLKQKKGSVIVIDLGDAGYDLFVGARIHLFDSPLISLPNVLYVNRGTKIVNGEEWQEGYENDRTYTFLKTRPDGMHSQGLQVENYTLEIGLQSIVQMGLVEKGHITLYVPRSSNKQLVFNLIFTAVMEGINKIQEGTFSRRAMRKIPEMATYCTMDLRDKKVFDQNIALGMEHDMVPSC